MEYVNNILKGKFFKNERSEDCKIEGLGIHNSIDKYKDIIVAYINLKTNKRIFMYIDEFLLKGYRIYEKES